MGGQQIPEKMLTITDHQGNTNQKHSEVSPHTYKRLPSKRQQITSVGKGVEERTLMHCWWDYKLDYSHYGKEYGNSSKN